uniref:synapsin-1-like isoform X2 n=1 Tax=Monopterus albus TaxID=43700 RepID=UPI0009B468E6|nr:synapsin-1-like isoform X2 [Monopterus albus]
MFLKNLEMKWKTALTSILEELDEAQFKKTLSYLEKIPQGVKAGKVKEEMPQIIIQYLGTEESILAINKAMDQIPRRDAAVQGLLRPFVHKLKDQRQKDKKSQQKSGKADKKKPPKNQKGGDQQGAEATAGPSGQNPVQCTNQRKRKTDAAGPVKPKVVKKPKKDLPLMPPGPIMSSQTDAVGPVKPKVAKKAKKDLPLIPPGAIMSSQTDAAGPVKPKVAKKAKKDLPLIPPGAIMSSQTDAAGPVKPKVVKKPKKDLPLMPPGPIMSSQTDAAGPVKPKVAKKAKKDLPLIPPGAIMSSQTAQDEIRISVPPTGQTPTWRPIFPETGYSYYDQSQGVWRGK